MTDRIIDIFCHWAPRAYCDAALRASARPLRMLERAAAMPVMVEMDARLRMMDRFPGYCQVPSLVSPPPEAIDPPEQSRELARLANDEMAALQQRHPERFISFVAALPLNHPEGMLREAERSVRELGAGGVQIFTNICGGPIDTPPVMDLLSLMAELDRPVWLHPTRGLRPADFAGEDYSKYELWWALGWPYETSVAMYRMVMNGVFEKWPTLKIITHHAGGMIPMVEGRLGPGLETYGSRTPPELHEKANTPLQGDPLPQFRRFFTDTATFGAAGPLRCGLEFFGIERLLFASDSPFDPEEGPGYIRSTLAALRLLGLSPAEEERVCCGNAEALLHLPETESAAISASARTAPASTRSPS